MNEENEWIDTICDTLADVIFCDDERERTTLLMNTIYSLVTFRYRKLQDLVTEVGEHEGELLELLNAKVIDIIETRRKANGKI